MACVALATGIWDDYDFLTVIGMLVQAFLFNCLMLPLSIWAMFKWKRKSPLSPRRADPSRAPVDA